jgi:anti-anti-sigma regulatory factor
VELHPEQIERLLSISNALRPDLPLDEIYEIAVHMLSDFSGYPTVALWAVADDGKLHPVAAISSSPGVVPRLQMLDHGVITALRTVAQSLGEGLWCTGEQQLPPGAASLAALVPATGHVLVLPMIYTEQQGLALFASEEPSPTAELIPFIQQCVDQITVALTTAQMVERHERTQQQLEQALAQQTALLEAIAELSTPVLSLFNEVVLMPVVGSVDSRRIQGMSEALLEAIEGQSARVALIDITGVPVVDTQVAAAMINLARAANLMGCRTIMVGIRPEIAQALVGLGANLDEIATRASLADGLIEAMRKVGWRVNRD